MLNFREIYNPKVLRVLLDCTASFKQAQQWLYASTTHHHHHQHHQQQQLKHWLAVLHGHLDDTSSRWHGSRLNDWSSHRQRWSTCRIIIYFASAAVAVDSSHMTASSSASWSRFSPSSNVINGHVLTMWFMVCRWPQSQEGDWARPHLCKLAWHGPWPVRKFIRDHVWWGRWKPGCRIVGSVTVVWLSTEADDQSSVHCVTVSTDVM